VLHDPDIVILDEPFSGLDPVNANILKKLIVKEVNRGKLVLFSSHQMPYVEEFCEHICIINQGEIVLNGKIKEIKRSYPRNRVAIVPEGDVHSYHQVISTHENWSSLVESSQINGDKLEATLKNEGNKQQLIQLLAAQPKGFDSIYITEPTLEEIFVEKAGDLQ